LVDIMTKEERSHRMSLIRSKDTKAEVKLRKAFWHRGCRYRIHYNLPGTPDVVFVRERIAIFVDGCFWHKCPRCYKEPQSSRKYWLEKIDRNVKRDKEQSDYLKANGWKVIRVWEHEISKKNLKMVVDRIVKIKSRAYKEYTS